MTIHTSPPLCCFQLWTRPHVSAKQHNTSFSELFCCSLRVSLNYSHQNSCRAKHFSLHSYFQGCLIYEATTSLLIHSSILTLCCQWMRYGKFPINSTVRSLCAEQFLTNLLHQALCAQWTNNRRAEGCTWTLHATIPIVCSCLSTALCARTCSPIYRDPTWGCGWVLSTPTKPCMSS